MNNALIPEEDEPLDLNQAAKFLKLNAEVVRKRVKRGEIPGSKATGRWLFIKEDLIEWIRSGYEKNKCSINAKKTVNTIQTSHCTESEYTAALGPRTKKTPKDLRIN